MQLDHPLMDINVDGHGFHSDPFNYNMADSLLLKLKGQVHTYGLYRTLEYIGGLKHWRTG